MPSPTHSLTQTSLPTSMLNILLLEDDAIDSELIGSALSSNGIKGDIVRVTNRYGFLDYLTHQLPDLILADYVLPTFDGISALELAQVICPNVPFILVSGVLGEEQAIEALKKGATDYVLKQRLERLGLAVQRALREKHERQERQLLAKVLRQTDDLLRAIVDASPVGIITLNREQRVMTWNSAAEQLYGWSANAVIDHPLPLIPAGQKDIFDDYVTQALSNITVTNKEFRHLKRDGTLVDISLSLAPLHDAENDIYGIVMTTVDITLHKQINAQRQLLLEQERHARAAAETANRLKDDFLAVLSHELRTPLNAIVGWIKLIKKGKLKPTMQQRAFDTIERNALAQTQLIEDLLDISRFIRGQVNLEIQPVNVNAIIGATADTLRPAAEAKSIQMELALEQNYDFILADPNRLQQIFWNLLSNAIKFTPALGKVVIKGDSIGNQLRVQVIDSGIGIDQEFIPHIFDYFRQVDSSTTRSQGGLGLGLAITRHLVELHGGTIHVESQGVGKGSTFTVMLPMRIVSSQDTTTQQPTYQASSLLNGVKAIVIDDETDSQELLTLILELGGAYVENASSAQEALDILSGFRPDVIITDIAMPDEDGYSLLKTIRSGDDRQLRNVPAIALTAYAQEEDRQRAFLAGFQTHIAKPFEPSEVVDAVYTLVHG